MQWFIHAKDKQTFCQRPKTKKGRFFIGGEGDIWRVCVFPACQRWDIMDARFKRRSASVQTVPRVYHEEVTETIVVVCTPENQIRWMHVGTPHRFIRRFRSEVKLRMRCLCHDMCICVYMCSCAYLCMYMYVCIPMCTCVCMCVAVYVCVYLYLCIHVLGSADSFCRFRSDVRGYTTHQQKTCSHQLHISGSMFSYVCKYTGTNPGASLSACPLPSYYGLFNSLLFICDLNIHMTEAGAMHEAGYVYSIRAPSTTSHLYILHLSLSLFWNSLSLCM